MENLLIIRGLGLDKKAKIFSKYVKDLYALRSLPPKESVADPKSDARNTIAKLLLNSLYGRFGMSIYTMLYRLVSLADFSINNNFEEIIDIGDDHAMIGLLRRGG